MMLVRRPLAHCLCALVLMAAAHSSLFAQDRKYEGQPIRLIQFDPRVQPLDPVELHDLLPLKSGDALHISAVRAAIERLFATGRYADIQVEARPYDGGVAIIFRTQSSWFIGAVSVAGDVSSPPNAGQLANVTDLQLGLPFSQSKVQTGMGEQRRLLDSNGLYRGKITPSFDWDTGREYQQVNIRFEVDSGPRAHFATPVLTGDLKIDARRVESAMRLRRWLIGSWKPVTQSRVRQAIESVRSLYEKENRLEAKVSLEGMRYDPEINGATPTLLIDAGPRIQINTIGVKLSQKKLRRYVPVFEEHAVDHDLLAEGARNLRDYLQSDGYFDAEVEFKEQRVTNDRASIDYLINTGKRHKLVSIQISGNRYFTTQAIRERMFLETARFLQFPHGRYSDALLRRDEQSITDLYESNGFRDVKVTDRSVDDYQGKIGDIAVFIDIDEGPQYFVGNLDVVGIEHLKKEEIVSQLSSSPGQPFSDYNVAVDRDTILARYFESGFPGVTFEWSSKPSTQPHRVDLRFVVHEGRQQFVRQVVVSGNRVTRESLIDHNLTLNPGDPLSPAAITETQHRLYDLGVFARVDAAIQDPDGETDRKYVLYSLDEARRYSLATGFGAELGRIGGCTNCLESPGGAAGFSPRVSVDVTRNNLWGAAHSISLRTRASTFDQRALLNYSWPRFSGHDNLNISFTGLFENSRDVRTFSFHRLEGSAQLTQKVSKPITLFYRFSYRRVGVGNLQISPLLLPTLSQPVRVGIASINLVQDRRDDPVDPHRGIYNTVDLGLADHIFGSQPNFLRVLLRNATYHPIGKRIVLARSTEFGVLHPFMYDGTDPAQAVPLAERFFGGGGNSHRGFSDFQAGPRDPLTGFPLGGNALLFNQTELRFPLIGDNIGGVLFHDMGNIYTTLNNLSFRVNQHNITDFDYSVHAVGIGLRYRLPIGPVRVDLGYSINPPRYFGVPRGYTQQDLVNLGPDPCPPEGPSVCIRQRLNHFTYAFSIGQTF